MKADTSTKVNASFCHMSNAVPAVCCTTALPSMMRLRSEKRGAKATALIISVLVQKQRFLTEVMNRCVRPRYKPIKNKPAVWSRRPAPMAHIKLAFCPSVMLHQMKSKKFPDFVTSPTSAYMASTP